MKIIIIIIIIIRFLTLLLAFISALPSSRVRTISSRPNKLANMRAVIPFYNNNEEIRYENKIKNHKNDIFRKITNDDDGNHK